MHVAVVIVGFRNLEDIQRCISALGKLSYIDFEVIICENGGKDSYESLCSSLPKKLDAGQFIKIIPSESNLGYAGGVNLGLKHTPDADAWWVLNPDTISEPDALSSLVNRLNVGDCDAVGGVIYFADGSVQSDGGRWHPWLARAESMGNGRPLESCSRVELIENQTSYLSGASMLISRNFLDTVGPMREDYFLYCEEVEWCLRGKKLGMKFGYAPHALVLHHHGGVTGSGHSIKERPKLPVYLDERNKILVTRDCYRYCLPIAAPAALLLLVARYLRRGAFRQFCYGLHGWKDGLLNRRGIPEWLKPKVL